MVRATARETHTITSLKLGTGQLDALLPDAFGSFEGGVVFLVIIFSTEFVRRATDISFLLTPVLIMNGLLPLDSRYFESPNVQNNIFPRVVQRISEVKYISAPLPTNSLAHTQFNLRVLTEMPSGSLYRVFL